MATKECKVNPTKVPLDKGDSLSIKVTGNVTGGAFSIQEVPDGSPAKRVLSFQDPGPPYETTWPPPNQHPAPGRHVFGFAASFFSATKYRLQVTKLFADGSKEVVKDCEYKREKDDDTDRILDRFKVHVS